MWFGQASSQELYLQRPTGHFVYASAQDFLAAPNQSLLNSSLTFFLTFHCPPHNPVERKVAKAAIPLLWYPPNTWKHKVQNPSTRASSVHSQRKENCIPGDDSQ